MCTPLLSLHHWTPALVTLLLCLTLYPSYLFNGVTHLGPGLSSVLRIILWALQLYSLLKKCVLTCARPFGL